jgi:hypothetical protein
VGEKRAAAKRPWVTLPSVDSAGPPEFLRDAKGIDAAGSTLQLAKYELHSAPIVGPCLSTGLRDQ